MPSIKSCTISGPTQFPNKVFYTLKTSKTGRELDSGEGVLQTPKTDNPAEPPKAKGPSEPPKAKEPPEPPKAKDLLEPPKAKEPSDPLKAKDSSEPPKAKDPPELLKATDPSEPPKAKDPPELPKAKDPLAELLKATEDPPQASYELTLKKSVYVNDKDGVFWTIEVPKRPFGTARKTWIAFNHKPPQAGKFEVEAEVGDWVDGGDKPKVTVSYENLEKRATEVLKQLETQRLTE
ncbi:hypothetical protein MSAN_00576800 [Mycena sanguinolenta]|uniref:Uncharacterized protein n=1 Tax=Mycena sanguinolenta TaxID=230812 RepID=A0A8H7DGN3_9AGAR|nr:hypothetical protein MSAN_00576800 [Mycena sanguinolenta]